MSMHTPQGRRSGIPQSLENKGKLRQLVDKWEFNYLLINRLICGSMKLPNKYKLHRYTNRFPIYE